MDTWLAARGVTALLYTHRFFVTYVCERALACRQKAMATIQTTPEEQAVAGGRNVVGTKKQKGKQGKEGSDLYKIVQLIMDRSLDPAIVFSFSKK